MGVRKNADHSLPHTARLIFERTLEEQVAGGVRRIVILLRVVVKQLRIIGEEQARHARPCTLAVEFDLAEVFGQPAAHGPHDPVQLGIVADARPFMAEVIDVAAPVLQGYILQVGAISDKQFCRADISGMIGHVRRR